MRGGDVGLEFNRRCWLWCVMSGSPFFFTRLRSVYKIAKVIVLGLKLCVIDGRPKIIEVIKRRIIKIVLQC